MRKGLKRGAAGLLAALCAGTSCALADGLNVRFFDAGKADAILLRTENSAVLIDSGKSKMGKKLLDYFEAAGIEALDAMIITHFDKDHVGGADKLLESMPIERVYMPDYEGEGKQYEQFLEALADSGAQATRLSENTMLEIGGVSYAIDVANADNYGPGEENDFSLVTSARYGGVSFLFAGDAENPRLAELIEEGNLAHDVLKVPHHGRAEDLSAAFFTAVSPKYAIITSDADEREDAAVVAWLEADGAQVYLTRKGDVQCATDGTTINFSQG